MAAAQVAVSDVLKERLFLPTALAGPLAPRRKPAARGHCPDITQLNTAGAQYWQAITEEESLALAVERVKQEAPEPKQDPRLLLMVYLRKLLDNGFLLEEDA